MTAGLRIFAGNRLEKLLTKLAELLETPLSDDPFAREVIAVQTPAMEKLLSLSIADRLGICANYRFLYPNDVLNMVFSTVKRKRFRPEEFSLDTLTWKIMKALPAFLDQPEFSDLKNYLDDPAAGGIKRYQISGKIAHLFDQYIVYRPDMMKSWQGGKILSGGSRSARDETWQMMLWKELVAESGHPALEIDEVLERLRSPEPLGARLPARLFIFGITFMPPLHIRVIKALSKRMEVDIFIPLASRVLIDQSAPSFKAGAPENPLLASLGKAGKDFTELLLEDRSRDFVDCFDNVTGTTVLSAIQREILENEGGNGSAEVPASNSAKAGYKAQQGDRSVEIHSCHSPLREIQALRDYLVSLFSLQKGLKTGDVLVMSPSIDEYAPYIDSVFEGSGIEYHMAPSALLGEAPAVTAFNEILSMYFERFEASKVLSLLGNDLIRGKFGITDQDLRLIEKWVEDTQIRWGIDGQYRSRLDFPPGVPGIPDYEDNTWNRGIERILLGCPLPVYYPGSPGESEILPYGEVEGSQTGTLGRFLDFYEALVSALQEFSTSKSLDEWASCLSRTAGAFLGDPCRYGPEMKELSELLECLGGDDSLQALSGFDEKVPFEIICQFLRDLMKSRMPGSRFLTGAVTFSDMLPLKGIPARVLCMIGMDMDAFPRRETELSFDLICGRSALGVRKGDRRLREVDRQLFLEALAAAGEHLFISWRGQDIRDNSPVPPSVVVSELCDYIEERWGKEALDRLTFVHRLQAFSPEYFRTGSKLRGRAKENFEVAEHLERLRNGGAAETSSGEAINGKGAEPPGMSWEDPSAICSASGSAADYEHLFPSLGSPPAELLSITVDDLISFFQNPCRYFARRRLGIRLAEVQAQGPDRETFAVDSLLGYQIATELISRKMSGKDAEEYYHILKGEHRLPPGNLGVVEFKRICRDVDKFFESAQKMLSGCMEGFPDALRAETLDVGGLDIAGVHLTGAVMGLYRGFGTLSLRYSKSFEKYYLGLLIRHLIVRTAGRESEFPNTCLVRRNEKNEGEAELINIPDVDNPGKVMEELLNIYREGLERPVPLFPRSSMTYIRERGSGELKKAQAVWAGNYQEEWNERNDSHFSLFFADCDIFRGVLQHAFVRYAERAYSIMPCK